MAPTRPTVHALAEFGSQNTPRVSVAAGGMARGWAGFASAEWRRTDGYITVAEDQRGPVDIAANSRYRTGYGDIGYRTSAWRAVARANVFSETRGNGTPLTNNDTGSSNAVAEVSGVSGAGAWLVRAYGGSQTYNQSFSSVVPARTSESLTQTQHVPSKNIGVGGHWTMRLGPSTFTAGADSRRVRGTTQQTTYTADRVTGITSAGGVQWTTGGFARLSVDATDRVTLVGALRADRWSSNQNDSNTALREITEISPKGGMVVRVTPSISVHAVASRAFRGPTLNELFRNFRAGGTLTNANDQLRPETLASAESGVRFTLGPSTLRVVGFWSQLKNAITNVTVSSTPSLITRQRRNAGTIRVVGFEIEEELKIASWLTISIAEAFIDSQFVEAVEPGLAGKTISQSPRISSAIGGQFNIPEGFTAAVTYRSISRQFDDDLNTLPLSSAAIVDGLVSKALGPRARVFMAIENLFNNAYDVGRTPVLTVGLPRVVRGGIQLTSP
jgi:outer membrane receptor protein involved in Fe transport